jgi:hypothetical protein
MIPFFEIDIAPQLDSFIDTEEAFTTFVNACAQAGAAKCLPVGMINKNATGSDVRTLITSTIDVSLSISYECIMREGLPWANSSP